MKLTRREFLHLSTAAAVAGGVTLLPVGQAAALAAPSVQQLVEEAYLYAFPLVLMDATKIVSTNTETATERRAPVNQLIHVRSLMDASSRTVVSPNVDTIYTQAWLDVRAEPMLYVVPETDRFFNVQVLDGWTNTIAVLEEPGTYAIVRSGWQGTLPGRGAAGGSPHRHGLVHRPHRAFRAGRPAQCLCHSGPDGAAAAVGL